MRASRTPPTGVERRFGDDELIVTKTDARGVITYADDVFLRVSALTEDEVVGQPHDVIRHPGMPRGIFDLLWETLRGGSEMFAHVVNLAADGAHYWVLAHVTPGVDAQGRLLGYHSDRRVPSPTALSALCGASTKSCWSWRQAVAVIEGVAARIESLDAEVGAITDAVSGGGGTTGRSEVAGLLQQQVSGSVATVRGS